MKDLNKQLRGGDHKEELLSNSEDPLASWEVAKALL